MKKVFSRKMSKYKNVVQGLIVEDFGSLRLGNGIAEKDIMKNRKKYFKEFGIDYWDVVFQEQVHEDRITLICNIPKARNRFLAFELIRNNDGLICSEQNVFLACFSADCVPVSFYDPVKKICGIAHSGWRGTLKNIAGKMIDEFVGLGSDVSDIIVYVGPAIGSCCYEVSEKKDDRVECFERLSKYFVQKRGDKIYLDLKRVVESQVLEKGIKIDNLEISDICTCCEKKFPSYYRDGRVKFDLVSVIGLLGT